MSKFILNSKYVYKPLASLNRHNDEGEDGGEDAQQDAASAQLEFSLPYNLITINGAINEKTSKMVTDMLLAYDVKNHMQGWIQPIHLLINSPGGNVTDAWQICDVMDSIRTPVFTIGSGQIASAALTIFINGEKGFRVLSEHTSVMSHQYSWSVAGKMDDLVSAHREFNNIYDRMENHFHRKTGLNKKIIKEKLLGGLDNWMTAKEAKKMKLADQVFNFKKTSPFIVCAPPPELVKKQKEVQKKAEAIKNKKESHGKPDDKK
jgi:ATP-dependent Clp protease protease subunit